MLEGFKAGKIEGCVLRPSSVVGIHDYKPSEMGKALIDFYNRKIPMLPEGGYNMVDVRDVANSIIKAIEQGKNAEEPTKGGLVLSCIKREHRIPQNLD